MKVLTWLGWKRRRCFAHPDTVIFVQRFGQYAKETLNSHLMIADVGLPRGGRFAYVHASHQTGLDVDIWLTLNAKPLNASQLIKTRTNSVVAADHQSINEIVWRDTHFTLIKRAAQDEDVAQIFINPLIKERLCLMKKGGERS